MDLSAAQKLITNLTKKGGNAHVMPTMPVGAKMTGGESLLKRIKAMSKRGGADVGMPMNSMNSMPSIAGGGKRVRAHRRGGADEMPSMMNSMPSSVGGGKLPKRKLTKKRKGANKTVSKKWVRTSRKHRCSDGMLRTVWKNAQTGENAIRRIRVSNGVRKGFYTKV